MALARWKDLCFDSNRPADAAPFWGSVLGLAVRDSGGTDLALHGETPEEGIWINTVPEPKTGKNRVHLDLRDDPGRLVGLGATLLREPDPDHGWHVLADPEGNEFCVFGPGEPTALVVDAAEPPSRIAAWWADVLGAELSPGPDGMLRWLRGVPGLPYDVWKFVGVAEPKAVKNRWHWDVVCDDVPALIERGATLLSKPEGRVHWHVLADPEGNEFCAFAP